MNVNIKLKNGKTIKYNRAYEVFGRGLDVVDGKVIDQFLVVIYPDELDHNVESEIAYSTELIDSVVITFTGE